MDHVIKSIGQERFRKLIAFSLAFFIVLTPFAPVFAQQDIPIPGDTQGAYRSNPNIPKAGDSVADIPTQNNLPKTTNNTTTTIYPSKYYNTDGTTATKHIFANGSEVGTVTGTGSEAVPRYVHTDQLTGSNVITNANGTIDEIIDYYPFGGIRIDSGSYSNLRKFAGSVLDSTTGLNYMNARYYDSAIGRFVSQDPEFWKLPIDYLLDPQQQNSYAYARNNPLSLYDPSGNKATVTITTDEKSKTGTVNVNASFAFWSSDSSVSSDSMKQYGSRARQQIKDAWEGSYSQDGINYSVNADISFDVYGSKSDAMKSGKQNVIELLSHEVGGDTDSVVYGRNIFSGGKPDTGTWNINSTAAHEFTHLLGVGDRHGDTNVLSNTGILKMPWITHATNSDYSWAFSDAISDHRSDSRSNFLGIRYGSPKSRTSSTELKAGGIFRGWR